MYSRNLKFYSTPEFTPKIDPDLNIEVDRLVSLLLGKTRQNGDTCLYVNKDGIRCKTIPKRSQNLICYHHTKKRDCDLALNIIRKMPYHLPRGAVFKDLVEMFKSRSFKQCLCESHREIMESNKSDRERDISCMKLLMADIIYQTEIDHNPGIDVVSANKYYKKLVSYFKKNNPINPQNPINGFGKSLYYYILVPSLYPGENILDDLDEYTREIYRTAYDEASPIFD